jgi:phytoene dehydrogenase-like protein
MHVGNRFHVSLKKLLGSEIRDKAMTEADVLIIGAGHNGLVAAILLARAGQKVVVLEEKPVVGGAAKTEFPFPKAPKLGTSTGAYLLGVMPPELLAKLGADLTLIRRDPHYFLPTIDHRYLLFGSDANAMRDQFLKFFSEKDWKANAALNLEIGQIRDDLAPGLLEEPLSLEATAERYIRPALRQTFLDLTTQPVENYLARFDFESELLMAMYAVTDGFSGLTAGFGTKGTGLNFLVHNMCRLPGSDGTWMIVKGGMGRVTQEFARLAREAGVTILTDAVVERVITTSDRVDGVALKDGREFHAPVVLSNADPFRLRNLVGAEKFPARFNAKLDDFQRGGTTLKVNLALERLPTFKCLPENHGQHNATIHLLPQEKNVIERLRRDFEIVKNGGLADFPTIEWYIHTQADPSLQDDRGRHNSAFFVEWVPYKLANTTWEKEESRYVKQLFDIAEQFAPGFTDSVVDVFALTPPKIEKHFGISYGHIHHVDNTYGFDKRMPYATPLQGLYSCSAGCHPAGSVMGCAGHNAAMRILRDLGRDLGVTS